ncbi:protein root UVB sensitive 5-like [Lactuca sativa]|uniref:protein root UVB sensitive 5-like n=1 Tax=Lactuca sativa TaxID=4236 RepID=UPI0022AEB24E|nr:protein root UVB sensitive 5-like [Lactuca sativa]
MLFKFLLSDDTKSNGYCSKELPWLPDIVKDFVLPTGFPGSVSNDYLEYMLLQFPTNVTGWICHTLVTSSLLKAVGLDNSSGTTTAASASAIGWVSKDGIGAIGHFFIGGRFGNLFDDDPKQWRMYADFIGSAGSIFDLTTPLYPAYFLPLASLGNLAKVYIHLIDIFSKGSSEMHREQYEDNNAETKVEIENLKKLVETQREQYEDIQQKYEDVQQKYEDA